MIICGPWDLMMISLNMSNVHTKSEFGWMVLGSETVLGNEATTNETIFMMTKNRSELYILSSKVLRKIFGFILLLKNDFQVLKLSPI